MSETETRDDARIEAAARALAGLEPGESWPTNGELGGNLTGTRDDEYRDGLREQARDMLAAADAVDSARAETITVPLTEWRRLHGRMRRDEANDVSERENARLRAVVEAVQALCDQAERNPTGWGGPMVVSFARSVRAALAVSSSGEAESGEALDRVTGKPATAYTPPEDVTYRCRSCGHLTVNEPPRTCAVCEAVAPAPVLSGGQADGEGRCEHGIPLPEPARAAERVLTYVRAKGDGLCDTTVDDEPLYGRDLESVAKAVLAARPVLSREALRERLAATLRQNGHVEWTDLDVRNMTEHVLDVLAGGEQA